MFSSLNSSPKPCFQNHTGLTMQPSEFVNPLKASNYCRSGNFRVRNVCAFNFRCVAKWQKLNAHVRNYRTFNFRRLSNWQKSFHSENFPIYGKSSIEMCNVLFLLLTDTATFFIPFTYILLLFYVRKHYTVDLVLLAASMFGVGLHSIKFLFFSTSIFLFCSSS